MNLWIISLFDPTPLDQPISPRFIGIANAAVNRNFKVTHFTSTFRHTSKKQRFEIDSFHKENDLYDVVFLRSMSYKHNMLPKRFIAHLDFAKKLVSKMDTMSKPDAIFISIPPLSTVHLVSKWGKKNNIPVIIDIIDPWPDSFIKDVPVSFKKYTKTMLSYFYNKLRSSFEKSSGITAISNGYLKWASEYHSKDKQTSCFYLAIDFKGVKKTYEGIAKLNFKKNDSILRLIYSGSLASSYDIPSILEAAEILNTKHPGKTEFIITGKGPQKGIILEEEKRLKNVKYLGWISKEQLLKQYYLADLGLIQHKNSLTQTITYKFFNYLSAGLPILNSLQTEMAELIEKKKLGLNNPEGDVNKLAENIEQFIDNPKLLDQYKKNALFFTSEKGDSSVVYNDLISFIEDVVNKSSDQLN